MKSAGKKPGNAVLWLSFLYNTGFQQKLKELNDGCRIIIVGILFDQWGV